MQSEGLHSLQGGWDRQRKSPLVPSPLGPFLNQQCPLALPEKAITPATSVLITCWLVVQPLEWGGVDVGPLVALCWGYLLTTPSVIDAQAICLYPPLSLSVGDISILPMRGGAGTSGDFLCLSQSPCKPSWRPSLCTGYIAGTEASRPITHTAALSQRNVPFLRGASGASPALDGWSCSHLATAGVGSADQNRATYKNKNFIFCLGKITAVLYETCSVGLGVAMCCSVHLARYHPCAIPGVDAIEV